MTKEILLFFLCIQIKHFIVDFPLQTPYQYLNKGNVFHLGGYLHSFLHICPTAIIVSFFIKDNNLTMLFAILAFEFTFHYLVDYLKLNINKSMNWKCNTHEQFWIMTGFDQMLHQLSYIAIAIVLFM